ncbi:MarR family winged helix-turn-helix transcriptional regulator [Leucobacter luti]|uniref:MarR family transcriptional regulator n=1 Tax=Leucobacter luti TaxID=340320 RepID=A0A4V3CXU8_9MICO|nr:MarR family winged helix-turn-helix transcriptional regulator [Leucobacter luti]MCW2288434.1 DNA-binding MarR family transcriptional regulator [Leucobacter luti]QYM75631.1 MarR family winged helix-turn-helix transcriptional regulator [Leucobacter luti]TCK45409.1 MarR family transcriptional regulator [Leucobacter luti]TDP91688.1 MarR family transcriptional regulator [Leucobacter luti]
MSASVPQPPHATPAVYGVESNDPDSRLIDRSAVPPQDLDEIGALMAALGALRESEDKLSEASLAYMKLGRTDMRALHFLIVSENQGTVATPGAIAAHLRITTPSTTKLLDRLERGGHITRSIHPSDRRAFAITITPETREAAFRTVGAQQAKRFHAAARLTSDERAVVTRFLHDMATEIDVSGEEWARAGQ